MNFSFIEIGNTEGDIFVEIGNKYSNWKKVEHLMFPK